MKVKVERRVRNYAKCFGIEIRQSEKPSDVGIMGMDVPAKQFLAMQFHGTGLVWIRDEIDGKLWTHNDVQFIVLHEVGHALIGFFPKLKIRKRDHEVKANAIALSLCVHLGIPVRPKLLERLSRFCRQKRV